MAAKEKAKPAQAGLGVKRMNDEELVAATKKTIADLALLINEADKRKITVGFNITKQIGGLAGSYEVSRCEITRRL